MFDQDCPLQVLFLTRHVLMKERHHVTAQNPWAHRKKQHPAQGHATSHLQLARRLVRIHNFYIWFVITKDNHEHEHMMEAEAGAQYNPE